MLAARRNIHSTSSYEWHSSLWNNCSSPVELGKKGLASLKRCDVAEEAARAFLDPAAWPAYDTAMVHSSPARGHTLLQLQVVFAAVPTALGLDQRGQEQH